MIGVGQDDGIEGIAVFGVGIDELLSGGVEFVSPCFGARDIVLCDDATA